MFQERLELSHHIPGQVHKQNGYEDYIKGNIRTEYELLDNNIHFIHISNCCCNTPIKLSWKNLWRATESNPGEVWTKSKQTKSCNFTEHLPRTKFIFRKVECWQVYYWYPQNNPYTYVKVHLVDIHEDYQIIFTSTMYTNRNFTTTTNSKL